VDDFYGQNVVSKVMSWMLENDRYVALPDDVYAQIRDFDETGTSVDDAAMNLIDEYAEAE